MFLSKIILFILEIIKPSCDTRFQRAFICNKCTIKTRVATSLCWQYVCDTIYYYLFFPSIELMFSNFCTSNKTLFNIFLKELVL